MAFDAIDIEAYAQAHNLPTNFLQPFDVHIAKHKYFQSMQMQQNAQMAELMNQSMQGGQQRTAGQQSGDMMAAQMGATRGAM